MKHIVEGILGLSVVSIILASIADLTLSAQWAKTYFTSGLVLFSRTVLVTPHHSNIPSCALVNNRLFACSMGGLIFKELEANKYAFRRKFFVVAQSTMMHGLLTFDSDNNLVIVKGYADWSMIAVSVLVVIIMPLLWLIWERPHTQDGFVQILCLVSFYTFMTAISLFVEYYRLRTITKIASELWSRKYVMNSESA